MSRDRGHVAIIGGGVIGLASAHYLADAGYEVTIIDRGAIGRACSYRNCGLVCPSHVLPLAEPGAIGAAVRALVQRDGAFRIRPRLDGRLWRWLWRFARRCNARDLVASGRAIQPLLRSSMELFEGIAKELDCEWQKRGLLFVYRRGDLLDAYASTNDLLAKEFDEAARRLGGDELHALEPALRRDLAGAWYFEDDAHLSPEGLLASWRSRCESRGVRCIENAMFDGFDGPAGSVNTARVGGESLTADTFVVATGAWTPQIATRIGWRAPIEPGKGYSMLVPRPERSPEIPMIFPEHRVAVTPLAAGLRLGSIMEFAGYDETIAEGRLRMLRDGAGHYLEDSIPADRSAEWFGWRPMTWDSTPIIGPCPGYSNVYLATGHNMLGLSMAPATGKLIAELVSGAEPHLAVEPYRAERFA